MRCLFALSATEDAISTAEEGEIRRIAKSFALTIRISRTAHRAPATLRACRAINERISQDPAHGWSGQSGIV